MGEIGTAKTRKKTNGLQKKNSKKYTQCTGDRVAWFTSYNPFLCNDKLGKNTQNIQRERKNIQTGEI